MAEKKKLSQKVDKRHRGRVRIGSNPDGKPIYKYIAGRTKAELEAARKDIEERYITGAYVQRDVLFNEFAPRWLQIYKGHKGPDSYEMYERALRLHIMPYLAGRQMRAIMPMDLQSILNLQSGKSESHIHKIRLTLEQIFRRAVAEYIIDRDPALGLENPPGTVGERRALTDDESAAVLEVAERHPKGLLLLLYYYLGVRRGEGLGIQYADFSFADQTVHIQRKVSFKARGNDHLKTTDSNRHIPVPEPILRRVRSITPIHTPFVISGDRLPYLCKSSFDRLWAELMVELYEACPQIESKPAPQYIVRNGQRLSKGAQMSVLTPHFFRHNYATMLYKADTKLLTASYWLGHSSIKMTSDIYSHLDRMNTSKDAGVLHQFFLGCQMVASQ